jgi:membrane-bound lytic murein transglycosylase D
VKPTRLALVALLLNACALPPQAPESEPEPEAGLAAAPAAIAPTPIQTPSVRPPAASTAVIPPVVFEGERREIRQRPTELSRIDRTAPVDDVWQRIRNGFAVPDLDSALVREKTRYYVARPDYLQRIVDRSRLYLYHIVEEIEKRGMPTELALLPMVESAFNPMAYSRAHASGLWQFIPGTGKRFELEQNWWYDGRRDIVESTNAALDYLTKLYEMHGDWHLALASYNWGENAVARAIAKNRAAGLPTDYASLKMPEETRHYIPKLQALKNIIANPEPLGIVLGPIPNQPYFAAITKLRDIDVQLAARLAEMPVAEFIALNPGFSRPYIRAEMTPRIVLPADKVDVFHDNLSALGEKSLVSWKTYHPRQGETFESIAKKHGITLGQLKEVNGIAPRSKAVPRLLVVPTKAESSVGASSAQRLPIMYAPPIPVTTRKVFHTVKKGETLTSIAKRYKVAVDDLKRWNGVSQAIAGKTLAVEVRSASRTKGKPRPQAKGKPVKKARTS